MLNIGNKTFMNLQEAVGWLLENNALPFQSTANYAGGVEIAMSTLINPSPAKVRVGSIIFFADSKVSTVVGVTSNSFIVSDQYNDLVDDVVYVSNVAINASGHLIVSLSNGDNIDAGLIKQVSNFSINGSQHLIATYNDGSTNDLGAIFSGNVNISGILTATSAKIYENIQDSSGHNRFIEAPLTNLVEGITMNYGRYSLCGSHLMFVYAVTIPASTTIPADTNFAIVNLPSWIANKIYPIKASYVAFGTFRYLDSDWNGGDVTCALIKIGDNIYIRKSGSQTFTKESVVRISFDLLIDNQ